MDNKSDKSGETARTTTQKYLNGYESPLPTISLELELGLGLRLQPFAYHAYPREYQRIETSKYSALRNSFRDSAMCEWVIEKYECGVSIYDSIPLASESTCPSCFHRSCPARTIWDSMEFHTIHIGNIQIGLLSHSLQCIYKVLTQSVVQSDARCTKLGPLRNVPSDSKGLLAPTTKLPG